MKRNMITIAIISALLTIFSSFLYIVIGNNILLSISITFGTIAYHFIMRLVIGSLVNLIVQNSVDYTKSWYRCTEFERKLYERLHVKKWKAKVPTYDPDAFDHRKHSWEEIVQASCQAEIVHEINIIISFIPIFFSIWFGAILVFVITSILAATYDLMFVIIQRYNRPRIVRFIQR